MTHANVTVPAASDPPAGSPGWRLVVTLGGSGALVGLLLVLVWRATLPAIEGHRAAVVQAAIAEVLGHPARWDTLYLVGDALTTTPAGDRAGFERAYRGFDASGRAVGVAMQGGEPGFADVISVMFAVDEQRGALLGMKILAQKETPGLGDKVEKDTGFVRQFAGSVAPLTAVRSGRRRSPSEVDAITGATISSRTVVKVINNAAARWQPLLAKYLATGGRP